MSRHWHIFLVALWTIAMMTIMFLFTQKNQADFDPDNSLLLTSMSPHFDSDVAEIFYPITQKQKSTVFHLTDKHCTCSDLNAPHIKQLDALFVNHHFNIQTVDISQHPELSTIIPSTPAIVIFDQQGQLGYLGPYSSGFFCTPKTSIIDTVADTIIHNRHIGSTVITESKGCYCHLKANSG